MLTGVLTQDNYYSYRADMLALITQTRRYNTNLL